MRYIEYSERNEAMFKAMYDDEVLHQMYKYITSAILHESEVSEFIEQLKKFENVGLSFYFYYMDTLEREDERKLCGFSNFALRETLEGSFIDVSDIGDADMRKYFIRLFNQDGYFMASDNFFNKASREEKVYDSLPEKKDKLWTPVVIK